MAIDSRYGKIDIPGIPENEPVFILRAQDPAAPEAIFKYAVELGVMGLAAWDERVQLLKEVEAFKAWPGRNKGPGSHEEDMA